MNKIDSDENFRLQSINELTTNNVPIVKHIELNTHIPSSSTITLMNSNLKPPTSSIHSTDNHSKLTKELQISSNNLRYRLCVREYFYTRLALISNIMSFLAIFGIILMIIENELNFNYNNDQDLKASWFIKLIITISTIILLILILYYHYLDIKLYSFRNKIEDWRVELTNIKIFLIIIEIIICAIHPVPRSYPQSNDENQINLNLTISNLSSSKIHSMSYTAIDVGLGLPMFFRLYLIGRSIMLHSCLIRDIPLRSFGYLNHVPINFFFLMKTYLERWPTRCLIILCTVIFLIGSWSLRACNYTSTKEHLSMSDSMWLFIITATTIGYGDQIPSTYCGRSVAGIIGLIGLLLTALLIAILSRKLLLTHEEKYVHTFVLDIQLTKKFRYQAANVIKFSIKVWYLKRHNKSTSIRYFQTRRILIQSIHNFQKSKQNQRNLMDSCIGFADLMTIQRNTSEQIVAIRTEIKNFENKFNEMSNRMDTLQNTLNILLDKITK